MYYIHQTPPSYWSIEVGSGYETILNDDYLPTSTDGIMVVDSADLSTLTMPP